MGQTYDKTRKKRPLLLAMLGIAVVLLAGAFGLQWLKSVNEDKLTVTSYQLVSEKLSTTWKIAMLSDLHNHEFGEDNSRLVSEIEEYHPDVILICGDMVIQDDPDVSVVLELCEKLTSIATVYYIYGNHEGVLEYWEKGPQIELDKYLLNRDVIVCYGGRQTLEKEGEYIELLSLSVMNKEYEQNLAYEKQVKEFTETDSYKIIVSHYPDVLYKGLWSEDFDLGLAGHYHGGQIIVPGLGGLYHQDTGFFPKYYGGKYELGQATLIISRGLGSSANFPRINNNPELVFIDLKPENK